MNLKFWVKNVEKKEDESIRPKERQRIITLILVILFSVGLILIEYSQYLEKPWKDLLQNTGYVFSPVALLSLLFQYFGEEEYIKKIISEVKIQMSPEMKRHFCIHDSWINSVSKNRNEAELNVFFCKANHSIDILVTNLSYFTGDILDTLEKKANNNVKIRILTLYEKSQFVPQRQKYIKNWTFEHDMFNALSLFMEKKEKLQENNSSKNFEIRIYDECPSIIMMKVDNQLILSFILSLGKARDQPHIKLDLTKDRGEKSDAYRFAQHFDKLWEGAKTPNIEDYRKQNSDTLK